MKNIKKYLKILKDKIVGHIERKAIREYEGRLKYELKARSLECEYAWEHNKSLRGEIQSLENDNHLLRKEIQSLWKESQ